MMHIIVSGFTPRHSLSVLKDHRKGVWRLVPTQTTRYGWSYDWESVLPGKYPTKREATEAKRAIRAKNRA